MRQRFDRVSGREKVRLMAPAQFSLSRQARPELLRFLSDIRDAIEKKEYCVFIDFTDTKKMIADGTLLFYATLDTLAKEIQPSKLIKCNYPKDKIVEQVLQHVGIFDILGKPHRGAVDHETVKHWCVAKGTKADGRKIAPLLETYEGTMASPITSTRLYDGIIEAMTNCRQHAYPGEENNAYGDRDTKWWMFSQERERRLMIAFCDLGVGIPKSLQSSKKWRGTLKFLSEDWGITKRSDDKLIKVAFELGKSMTGEPNRGLGLQQLKDVLTAQGEGNLSIHSGYGYYHYEPAQSSEKTENFRQRMPGTMITWIIPIKHESSKVNDGKR